MIDKNAFVKEGDTIEGWERLDDGEKVEDVKYIMKVISVAQGGVYAMHDNLFNKPHKDAKFFKWGKFKIYEP